MQGNLKPINWRLMQQVVDILSDFNDATVQLSHASSCISEVVPVAFLLQESLKKVTDQDQGVKEFKKKLQTAVLDRMSKYEELDHYAVATLLDSKYDEELSSLAHAHAHVIAHDHARAPCSMLHAHTPYSILLLMLMHTSSVHNPSGTRSTCSGTLPT